MSKKEKVCILVAIVGLLLAVLAAIVVPKTLATAATNACVENLTKIEGAKQSWALDEKKRTGDTVTFDSLTAGGRGGFLVAVPECPSGGVYTANPIGTLPTCSFGGKHILRAAPKR